MFILFQSKELCIFLHICFLVVSVFFLFKHLREYKPKLGLLRYTTLTRISRCTGSKRAAASPYMVCNIYINENYNSYSKVIRSYSTLSRYDEGEQLSDLRSRYNTQDKTMNLLRCNRELLVSPCILQSYILRFTARRYVLTYTDDYRCISSHQSHYDM